MFSLMALHTKLWACRVAKSAGGKRETALIIYMRGGLGRGPIMKGM